MLKVNAFLGCMFKFPTKQFSKSNLSDNRTQMSTDCRGAFTVRKKENVPPHPKGWEERCLTAFLFSHSKPANVSEPCTASEECFVQSLCKFLHFLILLWMSREPREYSWY